MTTTATSYTLKCTCGEILRVDSEEQAMKDALGHIDGEKETAHVVTCTRPAHNNPESIGVIVFIANPERHPRVTRYDSNTETYKLGRR